MLRDAPESRWASVIALAILLLIVGAVTIAAMRTVYLPHATFGMQLAWGNDKFGGRKLLVTSVEANSAASRAGLRSGDEISTFDSPYDRMTLALQSNLGTGWYLAVGQQASFWVENATGVRRVVLRAAPVDTLRPKWLMEVRLITYLISALVAGLLVILRPSLITWGFALFVILAEQPNILPLEFVGQRGSPLLFAAALFAFVPCAVAAGFLGLIAFAARFPSNRRRPGYDVVERAAWIYAGVVTLVEGVAAAKRAHDWHLAVGLMRNLAYVQSDAGRHEQARKTLREAALVADPTDVVMLAALYGNTALEEFRDGKTDTAIAMWRQAAALVEVVRPAYAALCFVNVGLGELKRGNLMPARIALRKGLSTLRATGHSFGIALSFDHFARLAKSGAAYERAARLAGFAQASFERGVSRPVTEQALFYELTDELRRELGNVAYEREWNRGQWMTLEEAVSEAQAV